MIEIFPRTAEELIRHIEIKSKAEERTILSKHYVMLGYIAGADISRVSSEEICSHRTTSLSGRRDEIERLVADARKRLTLGLIPPDWRDSFERLMHQKGDQKSNVVYFRRKCA